MPPTRTSTVFRIKNVPSTWDVADLETALRGQLGPEEADVKLNVSLVPSAYKSERESAAKCALVDFQPAPGFLRGVIADATGNTIYYLDVERGTTLSIDANFLGFTQLYEPRGREIVADIVAVTGLGGHAYGSWRGKQTKKMWLRDFLSQDAQDCRTMIYGYDSNLKNRGFHTLKDYKLEFLQHIAKIRVTQEEIKRPIIFLGHSFGGIIVAQSLVQAASKRANNDKHSFIGNEYLTTATIGVMFFGTPHRGILMEDVRRMLQDDAENPRIGLLDEIEDELDLGPNLRKFISLVEGFKPVVSFYERLQTAEVAKDSQDRYTRSGKYKATLDTDSALLDLPEHLEEAIPVNADHTNIVKFDHKFGTYEDVVERIRRCLDNASEMEGKFRALERHHRDNPDDGQGSGLDRLKRMRVNVKIG
ncbi:hypothetical protein RUND412_003218 [Rhizina undulata]